MVSFGQRTRKETDDEEGSKNCLVVSAMVMIGCFAGGCMGGISLFSSTHTHCDGRPGMEERMKTLEQKVEALETSGQTSRVSHGQWKATTTD